MGKTAEEAVAAVVLRARDVDRGKHEDGEDDESEDPLQGNHPHGELLESQRWKTSACDSAAKTYVDH